MHRSSHGIPVCPALRSKRRAQTSPKGTQFDPSCGLSDSQTFAFADATRLDATTHLDSCTAVADVYRRCAASLRQHHVCRNTASDSQHRKCQGCVGELVGTLRCDWVNSLFSCVAEGGTPNTWCMEMPDCMQGGRWKSGGGDGRILKLMHPRSCGRGQMCNVPPSNISGAIATLLSIQRAQRFDLVALTLPHVWAQF